MVSVPAGPPRSADVCPAPSVAAPLIGVDAGVLPELLKYGVEFTLDGVNFRRPTIVLAALKDLYSQLLQHGVPFTLEYQFESRLVQGALPPSVTARSGACLPRMPSHICL